MSVCVCVCVRVHGWGGAWVCLWVRVCGCVCPSRQTLSKQCRIKLSSGAVTLWLIGETVSKLLPTICIGLLNRGAFYLHSLTVSVTLFLCSSVHALGRNIA